MINNFFNNNLLNSSIEENHDINEIYILCQQENNDFQIDEEFEFDAPHWVDLSINKENDFLNNEWFETIHWLHEPLEKRLEQVYKNNSLVNSSKKANFLFNKTKFKNNNSTLTKIPLCNSLNISSRKPLFQEKISPLNIEKVENFLLPNIHEFLLKKSPNNHIINSNEILSPNVDINNTLKKKTKTIENAENTKCNNINSISSINKSLKNSFNETINLEKNKNRLKKLGIGFAKRISNNEEYDDEDDEVNKENNGNQNSSNILKSTPVSQVNFCPAPQMKKKNNNKILLKKNIDLHIDNEIVTMLVEHNKKVKPSISNNNNNNKINFSIKEIQLWEKYHGKFWKDCSLEEQEEVKKWIIDNKIKN